MSINPTSTTPDISSFEHRIADFSGNHHKFLLWLLAHPNSPQAEGMRYLNLSQETLYSWRRDVAGYAQLVDELRDYQHVLRQKMAQDVLRASTMDLARTMVIRAKRLGRDSRDAQRAAERILEAVGVLPKDDVQFQQAPIQVTTHTYVLVQPRNEGVQPAQAVVEGELMESLLPSLPPSKPHLT